MILGQDFLGERQYLALVDRGLEFDRAHPVLQGAWGNSGGN